jgi:two-component system heavy metal sensor histidine kinase CusS
VGALRSFGSSLTGRVSLLFAAVSVAILSAMGLFLYHVLSQQLAARDLQDLNGKVELVRHKLADSESVVAIERNPQGWLEIVVGHQGLQLVILNEARRILLASSPLQLPERLLDNPSEEARQAPVFEWTDDDGHRFRAVSAWGRVGSSPNSRVLIVPLLDVSHEVRLLAAYRTSIVGGILVGTLVAGALGLWAAKRGLTPLQAFARAASRTSASRLEERIGVASLPSELKPLASAYNAMLDRLADSINRLSQFSSDIAHDLRTPLGNLLGEAQVALSRRRTADEYRSVIESSTEELERVSRMIEAMLFLARADNAQVSLRPERLQTAAEFTRISDYFEPLTHERGISIVARGSREVYADPSLLTRAVSNLVANAIRATPQAGTIELTDLRSADGATEIRVSNPGPEIPAQERDKVFERFYRLSDSRTESTSGSGLGLAIVKSIIGMHGGRAWIECAGGRTTFVLSFPGEPVSQSTASASLERR